MAFSDESESLLKSLVPEAKVRAEYLVNAGRSAGYPVVIVETKRSAHRQRQLFSQGRTGPGRIVTWTKNSKHLTGRAFDLAFVFSGNLTWDAPATWWREFGRAGEAIGLRWGGSFGDLGHFEL